MNAHNEQHDPASPVVKQNLTTQPAAAQEAVGEVYQGSARKPQARLTADLPIGTKLYAAPVTAAPGIDAEVRRLVNAAKQYAQPMPNETQCLVISMAVAAAVIHEAVEAGMRIDASPKGALPALPDDFSESKDWRAGSYAERVEWLIDTVRSQREHIDALLDSPKGGSDWEATDADIAAWQQRHDLIGAFGSKTDARAAFEDARSAESAAGDAEVQP